MITETAAADTGVIMEITAEEVTAITETGIITVPTGTASIKKRIVPKSRIVRIIRRNKKGSILFRKRFCSFQEAIQAVAEYCNSLFFSLYEIRLHLQDGRFQYSCPPDLLQGNEYEK